jgi:release factor glutamine methyltransferase
MPSTWRVIDLIHWAESYLKEKEFDNPRAEIEWLLCALLDCNRLNVYLRFEEPLSQSQLSILRSWVKRRLKNEPLQYITGSCDFYGRQFLINSQVLIPRPETERLIDIAIEKMKGIDSPTILDVGTGSGCIATTLGLEIPASKVLGVDISLDALEVANKNQAKLCSENVLFIEMDILNTFPEKLFDLLVSNPPYIPKNEMENLMKDVKDFEPVIALEDENNGFTFYKRFAEIGRTLVKPGAWFVLEVGMGDHPRMVQSIFSNSGYLNVELIKDYNGDNRVLVVQV